MRLRTMILCAVAMPLAFSTPALAGPAAGLAAGAHDGLTRAASRTGELPVILAQTTDPRIAQLEEQVRRLSGLVEELNFQILQMQDQIQRIQDDNEFRFQELEGGSGSGSGSSRDEGRAPAVDDDASSDFSALPGEGAAPGAPELGAPPREFGSITFGADGSVLGTTMDQGAITVPPAGAQAPAGTDDTVVAALPQADSAEELYRNSYEFVLSGDYATAEAGFRDLLERYPGNDLEADANFWLGEALLAQQRPREAAEIFLSASREFPQSPKAPEILYKLGVSMVALNQRDVACATLAEVDSRFPNASDALKERVRQERAQASC